MKKLFAIMAAALIAFGFSSCENKNKPSKDTKLVMEGYVDGTYADYGYYEIIGMTSDSVYGISLAVMTQDLNMTINEEATYEGALYKLSNGSVSAQFAISNPNLKCVVSDEKVAIEGTFTANEIEYTLTLSAVLYLPEPADPYEYDEESANYAENFAEYTIEDSYLAQYGILYVDAENDNAGEVAIAFVLPKTAEGLTAGEYTISDSQAEMTVLSGEGDEQGYVYPSYAAYTDEEGYLSQIWYLISGKVTVNADGSIVVNAVNSKGKTIQSTLAAEAAEGGEGGEGAPAHKLMSKQYQKFAALKNPNLRHAALLKK